MTEAFEIVVKFRQIWAHWSEQRVLQHLSLDVHQHLTDAKNYLSHCNDFYTTFFDPEKTQFKGKISCPVFFKWAIHGFFLN